MMMEAKLGKIDTDEAPIGDQVGTLFKAPACKPPRRHSIGNNLKPPRPFLTQSEVGNYPSPEFIPCRRGTSKLNCSQEESITQCTASAKAAKKIHFTRGLG
jgi:hypothetical protein